MKVFLFHCWGGNSKSCWSTYIADQLASSGIKTTNPDFPDSDHPILSSWLKEVRRNVCHFYPKDNWVLVSHSLGGPTILRLLESFDNSETVEAAIIVAGFGKDLGISEIRNFVDRDFDWKKIRRACGKFIVISSDDDPYISLGEGERLAKLLGAEFIIEHNAGHINEGSGFSQYPRLLELIKKFE